VLLRINGLDTYYTVEGRGNPVILLHGWGASSQSLASLMTALTDTFRVLAVDLPGFGWSQPPSEAWGTAEYAGHVERLMQETGTGSTALVGHSFGGRIAIQLSARQPARVSRLVLVASAGIRPRRGPTYHLRVAAAKLMKRFFSLPGWGACGQRVIVKVSERVGSRDYRMAGRMRPTLVKVVNEDLTPLLPAIQAPTLLLWGDRDQEVPRTAMEIMVRGIPRSRLVVLTGAGHFPFLDMPEEFCRTLKRFLQEGDPS
jgi:pimeloyl-ACP methyl ester carboxylesterase